MTTWEVLVRGVVFGLGAAVPIGPVNVEMGRRALLRGWGHGVCLGLGAVSVDTVYVVVSVAGVSVAARSPWVFWPVAVAGTLLLVWLGVGCLRAAARAWREGWRIEETVGPSPSPPPLWKVYLTGVGMTAGNPMTLAFWFGGFSGQAMSQGISGGMLPWLAAGVFVGTVAWVLGFSTVMAVVGRWRKPWWMAAADVVGGVVLLAFAGAAMVACVRRLGAG